MKPLGIDVAEGLGLERIIITWTEIRRRVMSSPKRDSHHSTRMSTSST